MKNNKSKDEGVNDSCYLVNCRSMAGCITPESHLVDTITVKKIQGGYTDECI